MLSQLRWILGVAIGVAVIVAVWLEPDVRDPSGEPAVPRSTQSGLANAPDSGSLLPLPASPASADSPKSSATTGTASSSVEWQNRLRAYWADVDRILAQRRGNTKDHDQIREALLTRHFSVDERPAVRALDATRTP
ncbi:MAG TPA: hypothetical protein EYQ66_13610 [Myxococcales bacterium]|jgi:hypothetical protein|nr:hypothetical protein [Myxococcales bacterium]HIL01058.1 hypothetical protein [Myxococcales bacterium]